MRARESYQEIKDNESQVIGKEKDNRVKASTRRTEGDGWYNTMVW
jgi:hypothetical protein